MPSLVRSSQTVQAGTMKEDIALQEAGLPAHLMHFARGDRIQIENLSIWLLRTL